MNEDQIERWYDREMDDLVADLMNGIISEKVYYESSKEINQELNELYRELEW